MKIVNSLAAAISIFYQLNATLNVHSLYEYLYSTYYVQVLVQAQKNTVVDKIKKKKNVLTLIEELNTHPRIKNVRSQKW